MTAIIVDGKGIAAAVANNLKVQVEALGEPPHLAAVCAGADEGTVAFVKLKQKAAHALGIEFSTYMLDGADEAGTADTLRYLAADDSVHGIFVEMPLPKNWDQFRLLSLIPPEKDVDALTAHALVPAPAVRALQYVTVEHHLAVRGMHAAVVGHGFLVGAPVAQWLKDQGAVVDVIDVDTSQPAAIAARADLVVAGAGKPGLVTAEWVKEGAAVVDFGYAKDGDAYVGDVDGTSVQKKAGLVTPVPGGMGPLVIVAVLENLVELVTR